MKERTHLLLAAVGDLHCTRSSHGALRPLFTQMDKSADVLLLCGDLTEYGLPEEARVFADEVAGAVHHPMIAVLGNHDFESGHELVIQDILEKSGVTVLDGDACEVHGVGFAGIKGFAGGFGKHTLEPWGERAIKHFVQEAITEALKLESALARLETRRRVVLMHYSPVAATLVGEPSEVVAFLGSRRLEEPLNRFPVDVVFHGHSHYGCPEGRTAIGTPVYNVALPLLRRIAPTQPPFRRFEIPL